MGFTQRPNAVPAKTKFIYERVVEAKKDNIYRKGARKARTTIVDLCDFCNKEIRINRIALSLRHKHGWRISCRDCQNKNQYDLKKDKIWLGNKNIWE